MKMKEINALLNLSYNSINSDLRFAETKNTFLVTFNSVIIGIIVAFLKEKQQIEYLSKFILIVFSLLVLIATLLSVFSFVPLNKIRKFFKATCNSTTPNFMFYLYNASNFRVNDKERYNKFKKELINNCNPEEEFSFFEEQLIFQIVDLSNIAFTKFKLFSLAIRVEFIAIIIFALFIIIA